MKKFIFNTSMPRSGSELLQVILHQNPEIYASPTSPLLEYQFGARANYELPEVKSQEPSLMQKAFIAACQGMADSYYAAITDRAIVCDKNRGWSHYYEWVEQWFPQPKMICMVRDLRGILASMERIYRANRHRPVGPDNPAEMANMTLDQRVEYWLNTKPVGLALQRTADLFQRDVAKHLMFVQYEELCDSPITVMESIYEFIGEPKFEHDFENLSKQVFEDDSHFGPYGSHQVSSRIQPSKRNDWREVLPESIADKIRTTHDWYFRALRY